MAKLRHDELVAQARRIAAGFDEPMTLRQLHYQLVAANLVENVQAEYKRLSDNLVAARLRGDFPFDALIDRTRHVVGAQATRCQLDVSRALRSAATEIVALPDWLVHADRWWGQPVHVCIWVEKEALTGVFERLCTDLGVGWFACRGYPSLSALRDWVEQARTVERASTSGEWAETVERHVILYFGDHDPEGLNIPDAASARVSQVARALGVTLRHVEVHRIALTREQIDAYGLPPQPAKKRSSRYAGYERDQQTDRAWELDALSPPQLRQLVRDAVAPLFDDSIHEANQGRATVRRAALTEAMRRPGWLSAVWGG